MYNVGDSVTDNRNGDLWAIASIYPASDEFGLQRNVSNWTTMNIKVTRDQLITYYSGINVSALPKGDFNKAVDWTGEQSKKSMVDKLEKELHIGHEVIENYAGGKKFNYCRVCKTEVL
jgi:hypothetical protein